MVKTYVKIAKYEHGNFSGGFIEPLESLAVALETEINEDTEAGQELRLTTVEMTEEEYQAIADAEGW